MLVAPSLLAPGALMLAALVLLWVLAVGCNFWEATHCPFMSWGTGAAPLPGHTAPLAKLFVPEVGGAEKPCTSQAHTACSVRGWINVK